MSNSNKALPRTYTAQELSEMLQIPVTEIYRDGRMIPGRFTIGGRRRRWNADVVDAWMRGEEEAA